MGKKDRADGIRQQEKGGGKSPEISVNFIHQCRRALSLKNSQTTIQCIKEF